ncbi:hypothetical protein EFP18_27780 [Burkholderia glumae]|uniref:hypothetical protein n=1 Tax=Burkholderia glumae TaxID=337 RepID=UPI000F5F9E66|nr:hypothetical protein [Burkholderia glumae]MCQ0031278.1 hypothetical protein [Burkholderia glumae]MCQ0039700.1 hypothetical protein [Burkholderia glumae]QJW81465.1 hypothetical protein GAS18_22775 [Burkholderia glumae]UVS87796.1 hypothetical protein EFP18_27780 [Burkholderia glumae]
MRIALLHRAVPRQDRLLAEQFAEPGFVGRFAPRPPGSRPRLPASGSRPAGACCAPASVRGRRAARAWRRQAIVDRLKPGLAASIAGASPPPSRATLP